MLPVTIWILFRVNIFHNNIRQTLSLCGQNVTLDEFKALTDGGMIKEFEITQSTITSENDEIVPLEDILECVPNARIIDFGIKAPSIKSLEAAEAKISSKLETLTLLVDSKNFDVETLLSYMKDHQKIQYSIWFCGISNDDYHKNIAPSAKKVIQEWSRDYRVPRIFHCEEYQWTTTSSKCSFMSEVKSVLAYFLLL